MKLLTDCGWWKNRVNRDDFEEFHTAILADPEVQPSGNEERRVIRQLSHIIYRLNKRSLPRISRLLPTRLRLLSNEHYFAVLMAITGMHAERFLPHFLFAKRKSIYLFDPFPETYGKITRFANYFHVDNMFFSSSQATDAFSKLSDSYRCYWIPQGVAADKYRYYDYPDKDIDVLQFGRRYDGYHELIVKYLEKNNRVYLYENIKGEVVFPTREGFIDGLARSKISICVPCSITHPERAGNMSMMTVRYLQSMASKALIVGTMPSEMEKLFDYSPLVEIDMSNPVDQLASILSNYESYIPLIERNYRSVHRDHTWTRRWEAIVSILRAQESA